MAINIITEILGKGQMSGLSRYEKSIFAQFKGNRDISLHHIKDILPKSRIKRLLNFAGLLPKNKDKGLFHLTTQQLAFSIPFSNIGKTLITVHDMAPLAEKISFFDILNKIRWRIIRRELKKADNIISISEHTKKDIIKHLNYPEGRITVVYYGIDHSKFKRLKLKKKKDKFKYRILYVGSEIPRKNLPVLFRAFARLKEKLPDIELIKIGDPLWPNARKQLKELSRKLGIEKHIKWVGHVEEGLVLEYNKADLFVFPSLYEGFGFPVLESMACGCPVICSDKTSLPEVGGNAVLYFNPKDPKELAEKMHKVLTDIKLRNSLVKKGLARARQFTWEKTAKKTIEVYEKLNE